MRSSKGLSALFGGVLTLCLAHAAPAIAAPAAAAPAAAPQRTEPPAQSAAPQPKESAPSSSDLGMYAALLACAFVVAQQARRSGAMKVVLS